VGAQGTTTVNFGAFPGTTDTSVTVTGQAGIVSGSLVEAWIRPEATADHTADEHFVEKLMVVAGNIVPGTGFTIYARNTNPELEQADVVNQRVKLPNVGPVGSARPMPDPSRVTQCYGLFTVAWVWN